MAASVRSHVSSAQSRSTITRRPELPGAGTTTSMVRQRRFGYSWGTARQTPVTVATAGLIDSSPVTMCIRSQTTSMRTAAVTFSAARAWATASTL